MTGTPAPRCIIACSDGKIFLVGQISRGAEEDQGIGFGFGHGDSLPEVLHRWVEENATAAAKAQEALCPSNPKTTTDYTDPV
jgi:hypothetical protein